MRYFFLLFFSISKLFAQNLNDSILKKYSFIKVDKNIIENDSSLNPFFAKLYQLKTNQSIKLNITHIGDSHLQAGDFTGTVRKKLQLEFGNAGRGLIVPLKVARTNEPSNYRTSSNIRWSARRNVKLNDTIPIGLGGVTIRTENPTADLKIKLINENSINNSFNSIRIFHDKTISSYDLVIKDSAGVEIGKSTDDVERNLFSSQLNFLSRMNEVNISLSGISKNYTNIYGFVFENNNPGVLYHSVGVNGAEYRHYNHSEYFVEQMSYLYPDLYILSLGTNEAYAINFSAEDFYKEIDTLVTKLKLYNPSACFIITTPGDANKKRKYKNKNNKIAGATIKSYCLKNKIPYYNMLEVMGGYGSINKWYTRGLTNKDHLHLTSAGYQLQGALFYDAILKSYSNYLFNNIKQK